MLCLSRFGKDNGVGLVRVDFLVASCAIAHVFEEKKPEVETRDFMTRVLAREELVTRV